MSHISLVTSVHQGTALEYAAGNRTHLIYPDSYNVSYTYDGDNRLVEVADWNSGVTVYGYDNAGRLITNTLPNDVQTTYSYDDANRLLSLRHEGSDSSLLAEYLYQLDGVGNRVAVTETVRAPDMVETIDAYIEQNGLLVLEAENGTATASAGHDWQTQTTQAGYEGSEYRRALPDIGARYEETAVESSPQLSWPIHNETADTYSVWVRGMASGAGGDSLHVGLDSAAPSSAADLTGFTNEWVWSRVTMGGTDASVNLTTTGTHTLQAWMREDGLRVDRMLLITDTNYIPSGLGPAESPSQTITETIPGGLGTTSIAYQYDALYRLTGAAYTGAITATYAYIYDSVGNMTTLTETVGTETAHVSRTFDAANRLQTALDPGEGTTSYIYDDNGNLTDIYPPGSDAQNPLGVLHYDYDQRNLLITHTTYVSSTGWILQAEYVYDGADDRLQQIDHTGATSVTTTYTNDVFGLTEVLIADDGTTQVYNLLGLNLISQDNGSEERTLLVDGLGSVRLEIVDGLVETATTYSPYGEVLEQAGTSGTVYGFTGEQEDSATGLLYLRARYYGSSLKTFMSRDPWEGNGQRPATLNYYVYVGNNPALHTDPSGRCWFLGIDTLICGGVVVVLGFAAAIHVATANPPAISAPAWFPNDWYLYPGKWIDEACTTVATRSETEAERQAREHVNNLPTPQSPGIDVLPIPTATPGRRLFYYVDLSERTGELGYLYEDGYPALGRPASVIGRELSNYSHIPGIGVLEDHTGHPTEMINAVINAEKEFQKSSWKVDIMMGRKFEAERALWFAGRPSHPLINVSAYRPDYDFQVTNFGSLHYVQVKWGRNGITSGTVAEVIRQASAFPPGEFLLEANEISMRQERELQTGGGIELPPNIPYP